MILAIAIVPILVLVGIAIDLQNTNTSRSFIQYSIDNAVIAGAREMQAGKSEAEITAYINDFVDGVVKAKNYAITCKPVEVSYPSGKQNIDATIKCAQETTLTALIGYQYLNFTVTSGSTYGIGKVDVSMVFDVSGSMGWSGKMNALKDAARDAVDILLPTGSTADMGDVRIAMVSYSYMMDAGDYFTKVTNENPTRTYYDSTTGWNKVCVKTNKKGKCKKYKWEYGTDTISKTVTNTCVKERIGSEAFTDADPGPNAWIEPAEATYDLYNDEWNVETCNPIPPLPLTDNRGSLKNYINGLYASGGTAGHIGIAWGWYALAPTWNSVWPSASKPLGYKEPDSAKAMILMTDGDFLNWYNADEGDGDSFDQSKILCDNIKAEGVRIYTVAFQAPTKGKQILEYCASGTEFAFTPDSANELRDAYAKIATSISDLRIRY
jgi:Flp pilus assembly protein TadG